MPSKQAAEFVASYPQRSASRWFAARLLNETDYEATEANIAHVAGECGCSEEERETVIGAALDANLVRSTNRGTILNGTFRVVPALVRVGTTRCPA